MNNLKNILFIAALFFSAFASAQLTNIRAYMDSKQFYAPETGNYIEIYFQYVGYSVKYTKVEGGIQGELAVSIKITDGEKLVKGDAYRLQSPIMKDSIVDDFYDLKRYALEPGKYVLTVEIQDLNSTAKPITATQPMIIEELSDAISASDIEIIETAFRGDENSPFFKSGYNMIPRLSTFYPSELSSIPLYFELYNTDQLEDSVCAIKQMIINTETGAELTDLTIFTKHNVDKVIPILRNVDISKVPTGKFALSYVLLSRNMTELTAQSYLFERSNDIEVSWNLETMVSDPAFQASITDDSVAYYLESLIPIARPAEVKNIISVLKTKDIEKERKHIQAFWQYTSPGSSYDSWLKYKSQVQLVERIYSNNFQEGFETDRGRVFLKYGAPTNIVSKETSPTEYPYEIWQYNKIGVFSNKRFVFYNPDLVNNAYRLLHSDMIGELKNPSWQLTLSTRNTSNGNVDDPNYFLQDHWGGASNDLFRQY